MSPFCLVDMSTIGRPKQINSHAVASNMRRLTDGMSAFVRALLRGRRAGARLPAAHPPPSPPNRAA